MKEKLNDLQRSKSREYFLINLYVLTLVLYGWIILEATVRIRLKTIGRKLLSKT